MNNRINPSMNKIWYHREKKHVTVAERRSRWSSSAGSSANANSAVTQYVRSVCRTISCPEVAALVQSVATTGQPFTVKANIEPRSAMAAPIGGWGLPCLSGTAFRLPLAQGFNNGFNNQPRTI